MSFSITIEYTKQDILTKILPWLYFCNSKTHRREVLPKNEIAQMTDTNLMEWFNAVDKLEKFRDYILRRFKYDIKSHINSSFRCYERNEKFGGAKNSLHLKKWAIDIQDIEGGLITNLVKNQPTHDDKVFLEGCELYFIGEYKNANFIHIQGEPFKRTDSIYIPNSPAVK